MINVQELEIPGIKLITLKRFSDNRGWLNEIWRDSWSNTLGLSDRFVQDMLSFNDRKYILRGLHALTMPQYKLVSVVSGRIFDVAVDARKDSPTYGRHISVVLSVDAPYMLLIPPGCYHGYLTLEANTGVSYKVSQYHSIEHDSGIIWNDPDLNIPWPLDGYSPTLSNKDKQHPKLKDL